MKFEEEYWIITKEDATNYAKTLVVSSDCENMVDPDKPVYTFDYCFEHAKKQLDRNQKLTEKERKILTLKKLILKMYNRYHNDEMISEIFGSVENWFEHLGTRCKLNKIFKKENRDILNRVAGLNLKKQGCLF